MFSPQIFRMLFLPIIFMGVLFLGSVAGNALSTGSDSIELSQNSAAAVKKKKKEAKVLGFRSVVFGMKPAEVRKKIAKDFNKKGSETITELINPVEKTKSLLISVENIIPESGKSQIGYIFGYSSKKLVQVNILWGTPVDNELSVSKVVATANILRRHFAGQGFDKDKVLLNVPLSQGSIVAFRGADNQGRMVLLELNVGNIPVKKAKEGEKPETVQKASLKLSYILSPESPDVFTLEPGQF